jgi:hypothetical protein
VPVLLSASHDSRPPTHSIALVHTYIRTHIHTAATRTAVRHQAARRGVPTPRFVSRSPPQLPHDELSSICFVCGQTDRSPPAAEQLRFRRWGEPTNSKHNTTTEANLDSLVSVSCCRSPERVTSNSCSSRFRSAPELHAGSDSCIREIERACSTAAVS